MSFVLHIKKGKLGDFFRRFHCILKGVFCTENMMHGTKILFQVFSKLFIDVNFGHFFARFVATLLLERRQIRDRMAHPDFLPFLLTF